MRDYIKRESRTFIEIADDLNDLVTELNDKIVETIREKNADVALVKHGRAIYKDDGNWYCETCGRQIPDLHEYCNHCGVKIGY